MRKSVKPPALAPGGLIRTISPASPAQAEAVSRGVAELERLGYRVRFASPEMKPDGYFAGSLARRAAELKAALLDAEAQAIICVRGGYGSGMLLGWFGVAAFVAAEAGDRLQRHHHAPGIFVAARALDVALWADGRRRV